MPKRALPALAVLACVATWTAADTPVTSGTAVQVWPCTAGASGHQTWVSTPDNYINLGGGGINAT